MGQLYPEKREWFLIPLISLKTKILENFESVFLKVDIHRFISSTELFLRDISDLRPTGLKKVNFLWDTRYKLQPHLGKVVEK